MTIGTIFEILCLTGGGFILGLICECRSHPFQKFENWIDKKIAEDAKKEL